MSNRFDILYELPQGLYCADSPVIVSAGALLRDNESQRLVAQLKFHSVTPKTIRALSVKLSICDVAGRHIADLPEYHYLDLDVSENQYFGSNKAIPTPNPAARQFYIAALSAVFHDGTVWASDDTLMPLPQTRSLHDALAEEELVKQYRLATNDQAVYVPFTSMGLNKCACGHYHRKNFCGVCGLAHAQALQAYHLPTLAADSAARIAEEAAAREEQLAKDKAARAAAKQARSYMNAQEKLLRAKTAKQYEQAQSLFLALGTYRDSAELAELCCERMTELALKTMETTKSDKDYKAAETLLRSDDNDEHMQQLQEEFDTRKTETAAKKKKTIKRICIAAVLIAIVIAMVPVSQTYIIPAAKYMYADKLAKEASYDEAIAAFTALGEYKDAQDRVWETTYNKAVSLMETAQYTEASEIFAELHGYADSRDKVKECAFLYGMELMHEQRYEWAVAQFLAADGYAEADEMLNECYLTLAEAEHSNTNYEKSLEYFRQVKGLDTENTVYVDAVYQVALIKLEQGLYGPAVDLFCEIPMYEDAESKRLEAMYAYVTANKTNTDPETFKYITQLKELGYEDSSQLYEEIYAWKIDFVANYSSTDTVTDYSSLNGRQTCYIHFTVSGGEPDAKLSVSSKIRYPGGNTETFDYGTLSNSNHYYYYFNSWGNYAKGTVTFNLYDSTTNKVIATHKVRLT